MPLKLKRYEGCKTQAYATFNQALDEFYLQVTAAETALASVEVEKLKREAERLKRVVADQEKSIHDEEKKTERDKAIGNTIYSHFNDLQTFVDKLLKENREGKDWNTLMLEALEAKKTGKSPEVFLESFDGTEFGFEPLHR